MPSFSRAMSRIGRFRAAWEISMSDFGLTCCEAGIVGGSVVRMSYARKESASSLLSQGRQPERPSLVSRKSRADGELGLGRELAGGGFGAVGGLDPHDLDAAVGADHREAVRGHLHDLAELAADPLGV